MIIHHLVLTCGPHRKIIALQQCSAKRQQLSSVAHVLHGDLQNHGWAKKAKHMRTKLSAVVALVMIASLAVAGCTNPLTSSNQNNDQRFADYLTQKYGTDGNTTLTPFSKQYDSDLKHDFFIGSYKDVNGSTTNIKLAPAQDPEAQQLFKALVQYDRTHGYPTNFMENETFWASITSLFPPAGAAAGYNTTPDDYKPYTSAPYIVVGATFSSLSSGSQTIPSPTTGGKKNVNVTAQYQGVYTPSGQFAITPKPGYQYVKFYVTVTNVNDTGRDIGSTYNFKLFDSLNEGHNPTYVTGIGDQLVSKSKSMPGDKVAGTIVFEIKQNAKPKQLVYDDYTNTATINI